MKYLEGALKVARFAGRQLLDGFRKNPPSDRGHLKDIRSKYDLMSDNLIKNFLEKNFPSHSYLTEESGFIDKKSDYCWIIDPLDGTSNFVNGNPFWAVSVALWIKGEPYLGVMEAPVLGETFWAVKGGGAYIKDHKEKIKYMARVSEVADLSQSYVLYCPGGDRGRGATWKILNEYYLKVRDMRKLGSAALELAWVGSGRAEMYVTPQINVWDIAAGILFVDEAGGKVADFNNVIINYADLIKNQKIDLKASNNKLI